MAEPEKNQENNKESESVKWKAAEFEYQKKGLEWYLGIIGAGIVIGALALWQGNFLFLIFVIAAAIIVITLSNRKPQTVEFEINNKGVKWDKNNLFEFGELEGFDYHQYENRLDKIIIKRKTWLNSFVKIPVDTQTAQKATATLKDHLEKKEYEESFLDVITDWLGL